jgi:hypothetical protein
VLWLALAVASGVFLAGLAFGLAGRHFADPPVLLVAGLLSTISGAVGWLGTRDDGHPRE